MPTGDPSTAAVRGGAVGVAVAALSVAAHGVTGGGFPDSADGALVLLVAVLAGALVAALPGGRLTVFGMLAAGQFAAHTALSGLIGHTHAPDGSSVAVPGGWMLLAHAVATLLCGALVLAAQRLYGVVASVVRAATTRPHFPLVPAVFGAADPGTPAYRISPNGALGPRAPPACAR